MSNKNRNQFGARLKELRIRAALTQRHLATKVGVTPSYVSKIEHGVLAAPSASTISKIASILKADANELLSLAGKFPHVMSQRSRERTILEFGPKLTELKKKSGLSQLELARKANVDSGYISKLENGKMPPPSKKVLLRMAKALRISKRELLSMAGKAPYLPGEKEEVSQRFGNVYRSIKRNISVPNLSPLTNKAWVRVAISILLVVGIASSLWLASPRPVEAVTVSFPSTPAGTQGSSHTFTARVDITGATDLLPVKSIDIYVNDQTGTYGFNLTGVPLTATTTNFSPSGVGTVSVTATPGSNWAYATSGATTRTGYGYGYTTGTWGYHFFPSGYGYGYTGGVTGDTYIIFTVTWTPPATWPTGTYYTNAIVHGNVGPATPFTSPTPGSFTISAAVTPTPSAPGGGGEPQPKPSKVYVSEIVDKYGKFTSSATVISTDGKALVSVPKDTTGLTALGTPLSFISITAVSPPSPPPGINTIGLNYDFEPSGATFDPYAELTFEYNPNWLPPGATPDNLTIMYYDADTGQWVELGAEDIVIDPATNTITARVTHFTVFSVLVRMAPAEFTVSDLSISPAEFEVAEKSTISVDVANIGDVSGTTRVTLKLNGVEVTSTLVTLAGHDSQTVSFTTVQGKPGSYKVDIDGLSGTFTVKAVPVESVVITSTVPSITVPSVEYPVPTAPAAPPVPTLLAPEPTPWLAIILSLVVAAIVAGVLVWYFGYRKEYY